MISCNTDALVKQLQEIKADAERRLKNTVHEFTYAMASMGVQLTPLGDSVRYARLYELRYKHSGLQPIEGLAKGSWQVSLGTKQTHQQEVYGSNSGQAALGFIDSNLSAYKLGEAVYISNTAPHIGFLDGAGGSGRPSSTQAPMGITDPLMQAVQNIYNLRLDDYYKSSGTR